MPTYKAIVGAKGTVVLPSALCKQLNIDRGTPVEFFLTVDGQVHFHAITGTARSFGDVAGERRSPPVSIREMDDGIAEHLTEKHRPKTRSGTRKDARRSAAE